MMFHMNFDNIVRISAIQSMRDLPRITNPINVVCKDCQFGKKARNNFRSKEQSTTRLLELIHMDLCGPTRVRSLQGDKHFMLLIDDYYRMTLVIFLRGKSDALDKFKAFKAMVENEINLKIKCLRSYRGGEFTSNEFNIFCETHGIRRQLAAPRNPQKNGVAERKNMTLQEVARSMIIEESLLEVFWREEIHTIV